MEERFNKDYYTLLGIGIDASMLEIKQSYIDLLHKYPPERFQEEFKVLRRAYDTLKNSVTRIPYEAQIRYGYLYTNLYEKSKYYIEQEEYLNAIKYLKRLIVICPKIAEVHYLLSISLIRLDEINQGMNQLEKAIELDPKNPIYHHTYGIMLDDIDEEDKAERELRIAYQLEKGSLKVFFDYISFLRRKSRYEQAISLLEERLKNATLTRYEDTPFYLRYLELCLDMDDIDRFKQTLTTLDFTPSHPVLLFHFAESFKPLFEATIRSERLDFARILYYFLHKWLGMSLTMEEGFTACINEIKARKELDYLSSDPLFPDVLFKAIDELLTASSSEGKAIHLFEEVFKSNPDAAYYALQQVKKSCPILWGSFIKRFEYWQVQIVKWQAYHRELAILINDLEIDDDLKAFFKDLLRIRNTINLQKRWKDVEDRLLKTDPYISKNMLYRILVCYPSIFSVHKDEILLIGKSWWPISLAERLEPTYCQKCSNLVYPVYYQTHRRLCRDCYNSFAGQKKIRRLIDRIIDLFK